MKRILLTLIALALIVSVFAQAPNKMSYQAVIRNSSNQLVTSKAVGMKISILQGSATGTAIYVETQTPTTNANGLATIDIGGGTVVTGTFGGIDWSSGNYYIKTETDPAGGTSYTITGTSQLLSVPYSLYSEKAGNGLSTAEAVKVANLSGTNTGDETTTTIKTKLAITTLSGTNTGDETTATIKTKLSITTLSGTNTGDETTATIKTKLAITTLSGSNTGDQDGSETKVTAGTNVTVTGAGTIANPYVVNSTVGGSGTHYAGELFGGGVVFWVDQTGNHGLICSMVDIGTANMWTTAAYLFTKVPAPGALSYWNGQANTTAIVSQAGAGIAYAANLCDAYTNNDYGTGVYTDWYLPTIDQLIKLHNAKYEVSKAIDNDGNAATNILTVSCYWSSTEYSNSNMAWYFDFDTGLTVANNKSSSVSVRAVRAF